MSEMVFLQDMAVVMLVAGLVSLLFLKLKQPVVLGYIVAGIIIGPNTLPAALIRDQASIRTLADLGIVFLMFSLGVEFSLKKLLKVGMPALVVAVFEIMLMVWVGVELGAMFGWPVSDRWLFGAMIALTSTSIVVKHLRDTGALLGKPGELMTGIALFDDVFVILIMVLLPGFAKTGGAPLLTVAVTLGQLFIALVAAIVVGLLTVPPLLRFAARFKSDEMLLILSIGLCFGSALLAGKLHYSAALGAFLAGGLVAESREARHIERLIAPVRDMFTAIFFVAVGMLMDPRPIVAQWPIVLTVFAVYVLAKVSACAFGALLVGYDGHAALRVGTGMAQLGEFAVVLAALAMAQGITGPELYPVVVAVATLNALLRPYIVGSSDRLASRISRGIPPYWLQVQRLYSLWISGLREQRKGSPLTKVIRALVWQLTLNTSLIAGVFIAAGLVAGAIPAGWALVPDWLGGTRMLCWLGAVLAALPVYVVTVRKMEALAMLLAEAATSRGGAIHPIRPDVVRSMIAMTIFAGGMAGLLLLTILVSAPLLPPWYVLAALAVVIAAMVFFFGRSFNRWYSRAKFALIETWSQPPAPPEAKGNILPPVFRDIDLNSVVVREGPVAGRLIRELALRTRTGVTIVAIERADRPIPNPGPDEELMVGDKVYLLGNPSQLRLAVDGFNRGFDMD